ncbi:MAG: sulfatase-like hydrolase/transferase, partial [Chthoniobacteraceae bacterium]
EVFIHGGGGIGQTYPGSCGDAPWNMYKDPTLMHNGTFVKTEGYCTDIFFGHAIEWMDEKLDAGIPFFAYIPLNVAHAPLQCPDGYEEHWTGKVPPDVARFYGMIENIDDDFGAMLAKLDEWGIAKNTLVIFIGTDNGGAAGVKIFNAGMHGGKGTPYQGGTRAPAFFRWPAKFKGGRDVSALTGSADIFRTLADVAGVTLDAELSKQVEGRSLMPLLTQDKTEWPDRTLVTHVGRWPRGKAADAKFTNCSIRDSRFTLVNNRELYDLATDPGEKTNVIEQHPDVVSKLRAAYDKWWNDVQPMLVNEDAVGPKMNPFKELYFKQFGGEPDAAMLRQMDPAKFEQGAKRGKAGARESKSEQ